MELKFKRVTMLTSVEEQFRPGMLAKITGNYCNLIFAIKTIKSILDN